MDYTLQSLMEYKEHCTGLGIKPQISDFMNRLPKDTGIGREKWRQNFRAYFGQEKRNYSPRSKKPTQAKNLSSGQGVAQIALSFEDGPTKLPPQEKQLYGGRLHTPDVYRPSLEGSKFVFTCAQNNTKVHEPFWQALQKYCTENNAMLGVAKITYNKNGWQKITEDSEDVWYDPCIDPYVITEQVKVAKNLVFCAELDILPTMAYPLNGLSNYTGHNSAIVPHTKMQMQSLATMMSDPAKLMYSTGACTLRNYIQRRVGQIAEYHHVYGAVVVEVDKDGDWFVRQLNADENGVFYDLDIAYGPKWMVDASRFGRTNVNLADIHVEKLDPVAWVGALDMLHYINPGNVFIEDLIDFENRNHHNIKDPFFLAQQHRLGGTVEGNIELGAKFLMDLARQLPDTHIYSVRSNHDQAVTTWLKNGAMQMDPANARYWHYLNYQMLAAIEIGEKPDPFGQAMDEKLSADIYLPDYELRKRITLLQEDESLVINGIEYGMHGHLGPNGARGNPKAFRQIGRRANTGHTHSAGIIDGVWTAGILATLDMGYNKGPSSWSQSHILTYPNAKRCIVTQVGKKWRAGA